MSRLTFGEWTLIVVAVAAITMTIFSSCREETVKPLLSEKETVLLQRVSTLAETSDFASYMDALAARETFGDVWMVLDAIGDRADRDSVWAFVGLEPEKVWSNLGAHGEKIAAAYWREYLRRVASGVPNYEARLENVQIIGSIYHLGSLGRFNAEQPGMYDALVGDLQLYVKEIHQRMEFGWLREYHGGSHPLDQVGKFLFSRSCPRISPTEIGMTADEMEMLHLMWDQFTVW